MWLVEMFAGKVKDLRKSVVDIQTNIDPDGNVTMQDLINLDHDVCFDFVSVADFRETH